MKLKKRGHFLKPFFRSGRFYNNIQEQNLVSHQSYLKTIMYLFDSVIKEFMLFVRTARTGQIKLPKNSADWIAINTLTHQSEEPIITWIGHSTFLIQINKKNILTDPIFGSPTLLFPRILPPGIAPADLPKIDFVIISHNHLDHMDNSSLTFLKKINPDIKILVPEGDQHWFAKREFKNIYNHVWWQKNSLNGIDFTFLPALHWSQRNLFDRNRSLWGSWMIQANGHSIYFAGDTAYSHHFKAIAKEFTNINVALMPIGPCEPRKYMYDTHVNAEEAGQAFLDLNAKQFIPMHWGTFHFGTDAFETPIKRIQRWWKRNRAELHNKFLLIPKFGQSLVINNISLNQNVIKKSAISQSSY